MTIVKDGNTFSERPLPGGGVVDQLNRLVRPQTNGPVVAPAEARAPISAAIGKSRQPMARDENTSGGISGPLTETAFEDREYGTTEGQIQSTEGFLVIKFAYNTKISTEDADNNAVDLILKEPAP